MKLRKIITISLVVGACISVAKLAQLARKRLTRGFLGAIQETMEAKLQDMYSVHRNQLADLRSSITVQKSVLRELHGRREAANNKLIKSVNKHGYSDAAKEKREQLSSLIQDLQKQISHENDKLIQINNRYDEINNANQRAYIDSQFKILKARQDRIAAEANALLKRSPVAKVQKRLKAFENKVLMREMNADKSAASMIDSLTARINTLTSEQLTAYSEIVNYCVEEFQILAEFLATESRGLAESISRSDEYVETWKVREALAVEKGEDALGRQARGLHEMRERQLVLGRNLQTDLTMSKKAITERQQTFVSLAKMLETRLRELRTKDDQEATQSE